MTSDLKWLHKFFIIDLRGQRNTTFRFRISASYYKMCNTSDSVLELHSRVCFVPSDWKNLFVAMNGKCGCGHEWVYGKPIHGFFWSDGTKHTLSTIPTCYRLYCTFHSMMRLS